jgi:hypothetical protein
MPAESVIRLPYSENLARALVTSLDAQQTTNHDTAADSTIMSLSVQFGSASDRFLSFPCTALASFGANDDVHMPGNTDSDGGSDDVGAKDGGNVAGAADLSAAAYKDRNLMRLCIRPPQDSEYDMSLTIEATSTEIYGGSEAVSAGDSGGKQASTRSVLGVTVDAVNDAPRLTGLPEHIFMYEDYTEVRATLEYEHTCVCKCEYGVYIRTHRDSCKNMCVSNLQSYVNVYV